MLQGLILSLFAQLIGHLRWRTILKRSQADNDENSVDIFEYKGKKYNKGKCIQAIFDVLISGYTRSYAEKMIEYLRKKKNFNILDQLHIEAIFQAYPDMRNQYIDFSYIETQNGLEKDIRFDKSQTHANNADQIVDDYNEYIMMSIDEKKEKRLIEEMSTTSLPTPNDFCNVDSNNKEPHRKKCHLAVIIILTIVLILSITAGGIGCYYCYETGFREGEIYIEKENRNKWYFEGFDAGHAKGYKEGYESISEEYEFFHNAAVIVTTTGSKYHRYDCHYVENSDIYIYNIENAKYKGYTPCSDCFQ